MRIHAPALYSAVENDLRSYIDVDAPTWGPDADAQLVACYRLRDSVVKKFQDSDKTTPAQDDVALRKFLASNDRCSSWSLDLNTSLDEVLWGGLKRRIYEFFDMTPRMHPEIHSDYSAMFRKGRTGPGMSLQALGEDFYTKMFAGPLLVSERVAPIWELLKTYSLNPTEVSAFEQRTALAGPEKVTDCSSFSFVPKTTTVSRGICTEPAINMWLQLGYGAMIERRLETYFGICISGDNPQQTINRELARLGSIDDSYATLDLESASDSMSMQMLSELLPRSTFGILSTLRSPATRFPSGDKVRLHMVSTMGNGFTFPLMTTILASVVYSVYDSLGIRLETGKSGSLPNFAVFGDDIIVVKKAVPRLLRLLRIVGFLVNTDKSFVEGPFKESCGADFFAGVNVRPVYVKHGRNRNDIFVAINTLVRWSAVHDVYLHHTIGYLYGLLGVDGNTVKRFAVPLHESDDSGLTIPSRWLEWRTSKEERRFKELSARGKTQFPRNRHTGNRRKSALAADEARELEFLRSRKRLRTLSSHGSWHYSLSVPQKWEFYILGGVCWTYSDQKPRPYNAFGHLWASYSGHVKGGIVALRQKRPRYTTRRAVSINWDYINPDSVGHGSPLNTKRLAAAWSAYIH